MRKIVIDTSVVISALIGPKGPNREILRRCLQGNYKPLISNTLFLEYEDVSTRAKVKKLSPLDKNEIAELLNAFYSVCEWVPIYYLWRPNLKDEGDNFLIELAIAGNAEIIVTNNIKDLNSAELVFENLRVCKPEQILREVN
jgi:putative PIN family toxin of toxin-antitoxin system